MNSILDAHRSLDTEFVWGILGYAMKSGVINFLLEKEGWGKVHKLNGGHGTCEFYSCGRIQTEPAAFCVTILMWHRDIHLWGEGLLGNLGAKRISYLR